jgi:collagenase-like PrtC family protease
MPGFKFAVPYNNDFSLLEELVKIKKFNGNEIDEIYLPCPQEFFGSGRVVSKLTKEDVIKVIRFCKEHEIRVNMAINSTCEGLKEYTPLYVSRLLKLIKEFHKTHGLDSVIIANPLLIRKVKKEIPTIEVITSAFSEIDCLNRAIFFARFGADTLTLNGLNRDLETLKEIKENTNAKIRLMVNEGCIWKCPFRVFHNNYTSHASKEERPPIDFCGQSCIGLRKYYPFLILTSDWILPQWLKYYKKITLYFKIVGRTMPREWIVKRTIDYMKENYEGNLLELVESALPPFVREFKWNIPAKYFDEKFFKKVTSCNKNCFSCKYCIELMEKILKEQGINP